MKMSVIPPMSSSRKKQEAHDTLQATLNPGRYHQTKRHHADAVEQDAVHQREIAYTQPRTGQGLVLFRGATRYGIEEANRADLHEHSQENEYQCGQKERSSQTVHRLPRCVVGRCGFPFPGVKGTSLYCVRGTGATLPLLPGPSCHSADATAHEPQPSRRLLVPGLGGPAPPPDGHQVKHERCHPEANRECQPH